MIRRSFLKSLGTTLVSAVALAPQSLAQVFQEQDRTAALTDGEQEAFLKRADIVKTRSAPDGITASRRATLCDGVITHDAHIQTIDEYKTMYATVTGTEINFSDTYKYNIAAYRLDRLLDLRMVPVSIERRVQGHPAAVTWWVDDVLMTEKQRWKQKVKPPDAESWARQTHLMRVFDELIFNIDRNLGNILIKTGWSMQLIDHTRAFRCHKSLRNPKGLSRCDRKLFEALRTLNYADLEREMDPYVSKMQLDGLMARRDLLIDLFEDQVSKRSEGTVLYDHLALRHEKPS